MFRRWDSREERARSRLDLGAHTLIGESLTASEQMFFLGAPLAHVMHYEEKLRGDRRRRSANLGQARRLIAS